MFESLMYFHSPFPLADVFPHADNTVSMVFDAWYGIVKNTGFTRMLCLAVQVSSDVFSQEDTVKIAAMIAVNTKFFFILSN